MSIDDRPEYMPAYRLLELFREKKLSPVELLKSQMARIEKAGDRINAFTYKHFEEAVQAAQDSERRYIRGDARPLDGITVAIKDEYDREGWIVTSGSSLFKDNVSKKSHPVVEKLLAAGANLHVQTTAPEFFLLAVTWSDLWGVTRNPWNPEFTPGGSSGGSAAALAAGMTTLAIGSDMGGSIRIPCALNGIYGAKPPYARIASPDPSALLLHASPGPLARDFPDLILLQNMMCGPAPGCPAVLRPKLDLALDYPARPWKLALSLDQGWATIAPDVRKNTLAAAKLLEEGGAIVEEIPLPLETSDTGLRETIERALFSTVLGGELIELEPQKNQVTRYARRFVDLASSMGPLQAKAAAEETLRLYQIIDEHIFQKGYDALITPTLATTNIPAGFDPTKDRVVINGREVDPYCGWFLASIFSLLNWMPVINVPSGQAGNNVPTGLQIVTRPYDDFTAAAIASLYAQHTRALPFEKL